MTFRNFIDQLRSTGKLIEITHPVSSKFEAPRIAKEKGAPVLFHDVDGKKAVMNLL
ncbi:MAG: UbiD family decarboxylase, partial [Methanosarcinaceae archaeon]|nr:UbiD family decarboxylase [Methanosarcinaceae archaeon]